MTADEKAFCEAWCKSHAKTWQVLNRSEWKYVFHPKTLVRYVDEVRQTEAEIQLILDFLSSDDCIATLSLYDQGVGGTWKPTRAWLEVSNKSVQGVKAVRLFHGLQIDASQAADGPYVVEDGCAYKVYQTYYWNQSSPPVCPPSESGVKYQVIGLQRDPETGLFTYAVEKRERVQQDIAEYLTAATSFERVKEEVHLGVRQANVAATGKQASAGNGTLVRRRVTKNEDCTSNVENTTVEEQAVQGASEQVSVTLAGKTVTTLNRNMAGKASTENLGLGESVENAKTDGGRWNQTIRRLTAFFLELGKSCKKTVYAHVHGTTTLTGTDPGFSHAQAAGGGLVVEKRVTRTETGAYRVDEEQVQEQSVPGARVGWRKTLKGVVRSQTDRAQAAALNGSGMAVGETRTSEKTDGGLWNNTVEKTTAEAAGKIGEGCERTQAEHTHSVTENVAEKPAVETSAGVNLRRSVTARRTEEDTWDKTTTETAWTPQRAASSGGALKATRRTVVERNATSPDVGESPAQGKTVEASVTPNDHGSYDKHVTVTTREEIQAGAANKGSSRAKRTVKIVRNAKDSAVSESPESNVVVEASVSPNEDGTFDKHVAVTTFEKDEKEKTWVDNIYTHKLKQYVNSKTILVPDADHDVVSIGFTLNAHGTYDGHYLTRDVRYAAGSTLAWSSGQKNITAYYYYSLGGKWYRRAITGNVYRFYGKISSVSDHVYGADGGTACDCPLVGWKSGVWTRGINDAYGVKYSNIQFGDREFVKDEENASNGGGSGSNSGS